MDARAMRAFQRFAGAIDILEAGARQAANAGALDDPGNLLHRLEIAGRGDGKAGLDHIDAHFIQEFRDLQLLLMGHRRTRRLFAVAQRGVEDLNRRRIGYRVGHDSSPSVRRHVRLRFSRCVDPLNTGRANHSRLDGT